MIKKMSLFLAKEVAINNERNDNQEIYAYGFEILINSLVSIILVLIIGLLKHDILNALIYLVVYCSIRICAGGYHANNNFTCILIFVLAYMFSFICVQMFNEPIVAFVIICMVVCIVALLAPVDTPENPILTCERKVLKKKATIRTVLVSILIFSNIIFELNLEISGSYAALTYLGIVLLAGEFKNRRYKDEKSKKEIV